MVYLMKFGAGWVLPPGSIILALLVLAGYIWRRKHEPRLAAVLGVLTLALYLLCSPLVSERLMGHLEQTYTPPAEPQGDVIVMLGGGAMPDSPGVDGEGELCARPADRLLTAVRLQRRLDVPILLSGGRVYSDTGDEAKIAARILQSLGVPEDKIWMSFERKMSCAVGKCGHCRIDEVYVCLDGPVFPYTKAKYLVD